MKPEAVQPLAQGGLKDSHVPVVPARVTPELSLVAGQPRPQTGSGYPGALPDHSAVRVFISDRKKALFSLPNWEAADRVHRGEAEWINSSKRRRGIQIVAKMKPKTGAKEHTLAAQLSDWQAVIAEEHPELYVTNGGIATLDQVEGLPVVGEAIKLFYGPRQKAA